MPTRTLIDDNNAAGNDRRSNRLKEQDATRAGFRELGGDWPGPSAGTLVYEIEEAARTRRQETGVKPLGVEEILVQEPTRPPQEAQEVARPVRPRRDQGHAPCALGSLRLVRRRAYRDAAEKLRAGDKDPPFPPGCFPPALPFVSA